MARGECESKFTLMRSVYKRESRPRVHENSVEFFASARDGERSAIGVVRERDEELLGYAAIVDAASHDAHAAAHSRD